MDHRHFPPNPYDPTVGEVPPPFSGRERALTRLHQHLTELSSQHALTFSGRRRIGKTALLRRLALGEPAYVGVYVPLRRMPLQNEALWLTALARAMTDSLPDHPAGEIEPPPESAAGLRDWLRATALPAWLRAIRGQRRIVLLLDDLELLAAAIEAQQQPEDAFAYLQRLIQPRLTIAATIDLRYETELERFQPLVDPAAVHRLSSLTPQASAEIITGPSGDLYTVEPDALESIYRATGGEPALLQCFGYHVWRRAQEGTTVITAADVKAIIPRVYEDVEAEFQIVWKSLPRDERLLLTALSSLLYDDPLRAVGTAEIETWLMDTDYLLDTTAINAAVRGLEYYELISGSTAGVTIRAGLVQKWLLENAGLSTSASQPQASGTPIPAAWFIAAVLIVVLIILAALLIPGSDQGEPVITAIPTVTLMPGG
jgi:hypothetical protein